MSKLQNLESTLDELFVKNAPALPDNAKKAIVRYLPYINLILGIVTLFTAYGLYNAAHTVNRLIDSLGAVYGTAASTGHVPVSVWLAIAVLALEAGIYVAAFGPTRDRKKAGWDLLFYALLINVAYGIVAVFTDYGGFGRLFGSVIGSAIGLYFLFQIRGQYLGKPAGRKSPSRKTA